LTGLIEFKVNLISGNYYYVNRFLSILVAGIDLGKDRGTRTITSTIRFFKEDWNGTVRNYRALVGEL